MGTVEQDGGGRMGNVEHVCVSVCVASRFYRWCVALVTSHHGTRRSYNRSETERDREMEGRVTVASLSSLCLNPDQKTRQEILEPTFIFLHLITRGGAAQLAST